MKRSASDFVRSLKWGDGTRKPYTGNPYVRFDEGTEDQCPPPTLLRTRLRFMDNLSLTLWGDFFTYFCTANLTDHA